MVYINNLDFCSVTQKHDEASYSSFRFKNGKFITNLISRWVKSGIKNYIYIVQSQSVNLLVIRY
jgi:hypothetical protein